MEEQGECRRSARLFCDFLRELRGWQDWAVSEMDQRSFGRFGFGRWCWAGSALSGYKENCLTKGVTFSATFCQKLFDLLVPTCPLTSIKTWEADARKMVWISRFRATEESLGSGVLWEASNDGRTQPTNNATTGNLQLNFINGVRIWKAKYALFFGQALSFSWMKSTNQTCFLCFEGVSWLFNPLLLFLFVHLFTNLSSVFVSVQITDQVDVHINWSPMHLGLLWTFKKEWQHSQFFQCLLKLVW